MNNKRSVVANGEEIDITQYWSMHERRFLHSIDALKRHARGKTLEIGGHPWAMTSLIAGTKEFDLVATVSAEEVTKWPDDIGVTSANYNLQSFEGKSVCFRNYSLNIERKLVDLDEKFDAIVACEVIEHLIRAPHIMLLNMNRWLNLNGVILLTTPNGLQFNNPFRLKNARPAYRCHAYERHNGTFTLSQLEDIVQRSGFSILESGYWSVYDRAGMSQLYGLLSKIPIEYFQAKFSRTIFVIARKNADCDTLNGCPSAYAYSPDWEHISASQS